MGGILLIAQDWQLRALARAQLEEEGFEVRLQASTAGALALLIRGGDLPQLTIVDWQSSAAKAEHLWDLWRLTGQAPLILCAGAYTRRDLAQAELPPVHLLRRPFSVGELVELVRRALPCPVDGIAGQG